MQPLEPRCVTLGEGGVLWVDVGVPTHPPSDVWPFPDLLVLVNLGMCQKGAPPSVRRIEEKYLYFTSLFPLSMYIERGKSL